MAAANNGQTDQVMQGCDEYLVLQAECQSLRVNNCRQLIAEVGVEAVRRDNICKTQCSFALNPPDSVTEGVLTAPPPPPPRNNNPLPPRAPFPPRPISPSRPLPPLPPSPPRPPIRQSSFFSSPSAPRGPSSLPITSLLVVPPQSGGVNLGGSTGKQGGSSGGGSGLVNGVPTVANGPLNNGGVGGGGGGPITVSGPVVVNQGPSVVPSNRQPRPLFNFPSLRLPNLSDIFGL